MAAEFDDARAEVVNAIAASGGDALSTAKRLYAATLEHDLTDGSRVEAAAAFRIDDTAMHIGLFR